MNASPLSKGTLLIVDDTPELVRLLLNFLTKAGFEVLIAQDGKRGIERAERARPDLILLDVKMPGMDGFEVCHYLKSQEITHDIPIIFMTAIANAPIDKLKGFGVGAADYITKPIQYEEVLARVTTHLNLYKLQKQLTQQNQQLQEEITHRKQVEANLARVARLKNEFLANMSHELRTPLNAILGIAEAFQEEIYGPINQKQHRFLSTLEDSGRHLLSLINDILDFSRLEADKLTLNLQPISVDDICQASLRMVQNIAYKKRLQVSTTLDTMVDVIQADERRLKQILVNLLDNAVKFTPEGGTIALEVKGNTEQEIVHFHVKDTGIGIADSDMEHLFQVFVQLDGGLSRVHEGTGLGLSLVYRLAKIHGGSVSVTSEVDQGSRFTVSLPWQPLEKQASATQQPDKVAQHELTPVKRFSNTHILLAEDNETNRDMFSAYLKKRGFQITLAKNGVEAVENTQMRRPDLILMDIQMPVMNGLEAIQEIRANAQLATLPIIALTALVMPGDRERCLTAGANAYLSKPVKMSNLLLTIESLLTDKKASADSKVL